MNSARIRTPLSEQDRIGTRFALHVDRNNQSQGWRARQRKSSPGTDEERDGGAANLLPPLGPPGARGYPGGGDVPEHQGPKRQSAEVLSEPESWLRSSKWVEAIIIGRSDVEHEEIFSGPDGTIRGRKRRDPGTDTHARRPERTFPSPRAAAWHRRQGFPARLRPTRSGGRDEHEEPSPEGVEGPA